MESDVTRNAEGEARPGWGEVAADSGRPSVAEEQLTEDLKHLTGILENRTVVVGTEFAGKRLDHTLHLLFPEYSRTFFKKRILDGLVQVDGRFERPGCFLKGGEHVILKLAGGDPVVPIDVPFKILHEDDDIAAIYKPPGVAVHPVPGQRTPTLVNGLVKRFDRLSDVGGRDRPGLVHRLDRDTSGVMVIAKTNRAHISLKAQFKRRRVEKEYQTVVHGLLNFDSEYVDAPIARDPHCHNRMRVHQGGRKALTFYRVVRRYPRYTHVKATLMTGRTHQIRVHMAYIGHPILGDRLYGHGPVQSLAIAGRKPIPVRLFLHAYRLALMHPVTGKSIEFLAELPDDLALILRYAADLR